MDRTQPIVSDTPASFGMHGNAIGLTVCGMTNMSVVVETATNLATPQWRAMRTNRLTRSTWQLSVTNLTPTNSIFTARGHNNGVLPKNSAELREP